MEGLRSVYARYDGEEVWAALIATMNLYRQTAQEVSARLNLPYPVAEEDRVTAWIRAAHDNR